MNGYEKDLKRILSQHGWRFVKPGKGSHEHWGKDGCQNVTIPFGCKSRFLANSILKHCGIGYRF